MCLETRSFPRAPGRTNLKRTSHLCLAAPLSRQASQDSQCRRCRCPVCSVGPLRFEAAAENGVCPIVSHSPSMSIQAQVAEVRAHIAFRVDSQTHSTPPRINAPGCGIGLLDAGRPRTGGKCSPHDWFLLFHSTSTWHHVPYVPQAYFKIRDQSRSDAAPCFPMVPARNYKRDANSDPNKGRHGVWPTLYGVTRLDQSSGDSRGSQLLLQGTSQQRRPAMSHQVLRCGCSTWMSFAGGKRVARK